MRTGTTTRTTTTTRARTTSADVTRDEHVAGILLVDKPAGPTSAAVVDWIRWCLRRCPAGHFGTLDPAATGLLVIGVGAATRLSPYLTATDKRYRATFVLGRSTTTADADGDTIEAADVEPRTWQAVPAIVQSLVGELALAPPSYSAVKIGGQRAHTLARAGTLLELEARPMTVHALTDIELDPANAAVSATLHVSKGTYVRSIALELGRRLACPAHLGALRRLACGTARVDTPGVLSGFDVQPAPPGRNGKPRHRIRLREIPDDREAQRAALERHLVAPADVVPCPVHRVREDEAGAGLRLMQAIAHGQPVRADDPGWVTPPGPPEDEARLAVASADGSGLVMAFRDGDRIRPERTILPWRGVRERATS